MTKHQTTKHRKQRKKERANRKVRQHQQDKLLSRIAEQPLVTEVHLPVSPARRAFQDL